MSSDDPVDVDAEVAALYRDPPEAFVAGRNGLAKALRAAKRRDEAATVAKLRRPSRLAWAFNAALSGDPALGDRLDGAVTAVADAQDGSGSVREASAGLRAAVADLVDAAAEAADSAGHQHDRSTLTPSALAVVGDPDALAALRAGRLDDVPSGGGFGFGLALPDDLPATPRRAARAAGSASPAAGRKPRRGTERAGDDNGRADGADEARESDDGDDHDDEAAAEARRALDEAQGEAAVAAGAVEEATASLTEAGERVAEAEEHLAAAEAAVADARRRRSEADDALDAARTRQRGADEAVAVARTALSRHGA